MKTEITEKQLALLNEMAGWLAHQKGSIPREYSKELSALIIDLKKGQPL